MKIRKLLINGGCGFLGSNLAQHALKTGIELVIFDNLSRLGAERNLKWLKEQGNFKFIHGDVRNTNDVENLIRNEKPDAIFHVAGQVAMTTSIADPRKDFEINALGTFNVLDSVRKYSPDTCVLFSSTNKVYGDLEQYHYTETDSRYECDEFPHGFDESVPLEFHSPYGCSKGTADQYMQDFARIYGLKTVVFRHSSMYGGRQFATYDQGWIGWFCQKALEIKNGELTEPFTISGNGKQVRDVLYADDIVRLYFACVDNIEKVSGQVFNVGGGMENSLSLLELFALLESKLNIKMSYRQIPWRASDQKVFVADNGKIHNLIGWAPVVSKEEGIGEMLSWCSGRECADKSDGEQAARPLVSILIPVYNRESLLPACIESALAQTYKNIEIVIVDNKSTDRTWEICKAYAAKHDNIRIYQNKENIGPVSNWQECVRHASGEIGKLLFSDDLIYETYLEKTVPLLKPDVAFVFSCVEISSEPGSNIASYRYMEHSGLIDSKQYLSNCVAEEFQLVSPGAGLFHMEDLRKNILSGNVIESPSVKDFSRHGAGPDLLLYLITALHYPKVAFVNEILGLFRSHEGSISVQENRRNYLSKCYLQARVFFCEKYMPYLAQKYLNQKWVEYVLANDAYIDFKDFIKQYTYQPNKYSQEYTITYD